MDDTYKELYQPILHTKQSFLSINPQNFKEEEEEEEEEDYNRPLAPLPPHPSSFDSLPRTDMIRARLLGGEMLLDILWRGEMNEEILNVVGERGRRMCWIIPGEEDLNMRVGDEWNVWGEKLNGDWEVDENGEWKNEEIGGVKSDMMFGYAPWRDVWCPCVYVKCLSMFTIDGDEISTEDAQEMTHENISNPNSLLYKILFFKLNPLLSSDHEYFYFPLLIDDEHISETASAIRNGRTFYYNEEDSGLEWEVKILGKKESYRLLYESLQTLYTRIDHLSTQTFLNTNSSQLLDDLQHTCLSTTYIP